MSTISENLLALAQCKADIKDAIIAKGVEVLDSDAFSTYATKISQIPSGGGQNPIYYWDLTGENPLVDKLQDKTAIMTDGTIDSNGFTVTTSNSRINFQIPFRCYTRTEIEIGSMLDGGVDHNGAVIVYADSNGNNSYGLKWLKVSSYWAVWTSNNWENMGIGNNPSYFQNSKLTIEIDLERRMLVYKDDTLLYTTSGKIPERQYLTIGDKGYTFKTMTVKSLKYYELEH